MRPRPTRPTLLSLLALALAIPADAVDIWRTTGNRSELLRQQPDAVFAPGRGSGGIVIAIDPSRTFQAIEGYGAAMTNSSAWVLQNRLNEDQRTRLMQDLFSGSDGIQIDYLRLAMGASDFTADGFYTYNDLPPGRTDAVQRGFSIDPDRATILPSLDQAREINPELRLLASPWSAPAWMKTSGSLIGGSLDPQWHASYATYLRRFVEAYADAGHPIDAITLQNEPLHSPGDYPGMLMSAEQQIDLIKNHVGPAFDQAGLSTQLFAYDHNWDNTEYPISVLDDPQARQYVAGTAFHGYAGEVSAQSVVHDAHPDKAIYFTEIAGGDFAPNFEDNLIWNARNLLIGVPRNWGSTVLYWNLALDENGGPRQGGCPNCRGVVTIDSTTGAVTPNEEFYALGHASRFVQRGAVRIDSTTIDGVVETVAFKNPDGSTALIALNPGFSDQSIRIAGGAEHLNQNLPARSVTTFVWDAEDLADFDNGGFELGGFDTTGGSLDGWLAWGVTGENVGVSTEIASEGEHALKLSEPASANGFSGVAQGITVEAGERLVADALVRLPDADSIAGTGNSLLMKIEYYDQHAGAFGSPEFLGQTEIVVADGATPPAEWVHHRLDEVAPAGAVEARLVFAYQRSGSAVGAVLVDDVRFGIREPLAGDFNGDGVVDGADYTVWRDDGGATYQPADYVDWRINFGRSTDNPAAVPEPLATLLLVTAAAALARVHAREPRRGADTDVVATD